MGKTIIDIRLEELEKQIREIRHDLDISRLMEEIKEEWRKNANTINTSSIVESITLEAKDKIKPLIKEVISTEMPKVDLSEINKAISEINDRLKNLEIQIAVTNDELNKIKEHHSIKIVEPYTGTDTSTQSQQP